MDLSSFITSLGTSFLIFVLLMLLFSRLSRKSGNELIYYPNRILKGLDPYITTSRNPFSWVKEALSSSENEIISVSGVDSAVYFVFLSTALSVMIVAGIMLLPALLPVAITDHSLIINVTINGSFEELDNLSMRHIRQGSPRLWAYMVAVYWVSLVTYYLLWKAYKHVSNLRAEALMSPEIRPEQFVVVVRDIPSPKDEQLDLYSPSPKEERQTRQEQVDFYFKQIYPDTFYKSLIVTDNKVNKIWSELEKYRKKLTGAESAYSQSKTITKPEGVRPTTLTGFLGLCGEKVDSIDYYNENINKLIPKLEKEQKITLQDRQLCSALAFFNSRVIAASAARSLHAQMVDTWTVMEAPEKRQLIWSNLTLNYYARVVRKYVVYIIVALTILFYSFPVYFISAFTTVENLVKLLPSTENVVKIPAVRTILEAYIPQLTLKLFMAFILPKIVLFLSKAEGIPSESHAVRAASGKYFYFTVFNVFIGVTLGGNIIYGFIFGESQPNEIDDIIGTRLPGAATFFVTYVALEFFVAYGLELSRLIPLIIFHIKKKYICETEAEVKEAWTPGDFEYVTRFPNDLLILTITLCYSVIAPLIIPFGVIYFGLGWLILRNQALKVYVPSFESYGRMWPHIHTRFLAALLLNQVTMLCYFKVKKFSYFIIITPLPVISLVFAFVCHKKFYHFFKHTALDVACRELKEAPNCEQIYRSFLPPSLSSVILNDNKDSQSEEIV